MHNIAVVRLLDDELVWYPPGAGEHPHPLDTDEAVAQLRTMLPRQRWSLCFAAPAEDVRLLRLAVSAEEKKHLAQSLPFMLEERLADDVEDLHFASVALGRLDYAVALCSHACMEHWQERLDPLGTVANWVPESLLLPWREGEWCVLLERGRAVVRQGASEGFGCERELLPLLLEAAGDGPGEQGLPTSVVVYGEDREADIALFPPALAERAQWRRGGLSAALMLVEALPPINLRQGDYAPRLPLQRWWREWRTVAAVFVAVFALQLLASWQDLRSAQAQNLALRTALEESFREANPRGAMVDAEKQLSRQLAELRGSGPAGGFMPLLASVSNVVAGEPGTTLASLNYAARAGEMRMNILAEDFATVERVRAGLNGAGLDAVMESSSARNDGVRARIRVGEGS